MEEKKPRQTYGREQQDKLHQVFAKAANENPKNRHAMSMRNLIGTLSAEIRALRERGYTIDEICALITAAKEFEHLAQSTLRRYVSATTGTPRPRKRGAKARAKPPTPAPHAAPREPPGQAHPGDETPSGSTRRGEFEIAPDREDL